MKNKLLVVLLSILPCTVFGAPHFQKVLVIVFENTDFGDALKQPYFNSLVKEGSLLTNYHALTHPSQGNYISMIAGSLLGVRDDKPVDLSGNHLGDLLEEKGKSWKAYAEDYPGQCFLGKTSGRYARKHVPFLSFTNVTSHADRCARVVNASEFSRDVANGNLPDYSLYIPNLDNDGHDTGVAYGDKWLRKNMDAFLHSKDFPKDLLVVITFDESSHNSDNKIYMLLWGNSVLPGSTSASNYNHYNLLRTIEDNLLLGSLGRNDQTAVSFSGIWKNE